MTITRRDFTRGALDLGTGLSVGFPAVLRRAYAAEPIKIGVPTVLSGGNVQYGIQAKRACELFEKETKAKGGLLGRPLEFIYEDTASDPATAVRKAQKLVEKNGVKFLTGVVLSSEALAVSAKCREGKVIFMSTINGVGSLTTTNFNRYFFRVNTSGHMGTRAVTLYLQESPMKKFFGPDFVPLGTKDFASYIAKVKQAKPDGCFIVVPGQDATILFKQAAQVGLTKETRFIMEILEMENMKAVGDAMEGIIGGSRYPFTLDNPKNRDFVKRFHEMHGVYPDRSGGEPWEGVGWLAQVIQKAGTADEVEKVIEAWEDSSYDGLEGKFFMRKCDQQAVQPGFVAEAVKDPKYPHLVPRVIATYPGDKVTPKCRSEEFA